MPRSRHPGNYPETFAKLLAAAANVPSGITIPFANTQELMRTRSSMYAYITALDKQEESLTISFELRLSPAFRQIKLTADKATNTLLLQNRRFTSEILAIESVLAGLPDVPIQQDNNATPLEMPPTEVDTTQEDLIHKLFHPTSNTTKVNKDV